MRRADESAEARRARLAQWYLCRDCGHQGVCGDMLEHVERTGHRQVCLAPARREPAGAGRRA